MIPLLVVALRIYVTGLSIVMLFLFSSSDLNPFSFTAICLPWPVVVPVMGTHWYFNIHRKEKRRQTISKYKSGRREYRHVLSASIDDLVKEQEATNAARGPS